MRSFTRQLYEGSDSADGRGFWQRLAVDLKECPFVQSRYRELMHELEKRKDFESLGADGHVKTALKVKGTIPNHKKQPDVALAVADRSS